MKRVCQKRPSGITTLALFECAGAISFLGLLFFTPVGSRDFMAFVIGALLGFVVMYGLWTLQFWAFWLTAINEALEIVYELFLITQYGHSIVHLAGSLFGIFMSVITLAYIFLDRSVRPVFRRVAAS